MTGDAMVFPETFEEFAKAYSIVDRKEVYTNGSNLIPVFRVKQWLENTAIRQKMVDRNALLILSDELEDDACWEVQTPGNTRVAWRLKDTCDRIREALGVEK